MAQAKNAKGNDLPQVLSIGVKVVCGALKVVINFVVVFVHVVVISGPGPRHLIIVIIIFYNVSCTKQQLK